MINSKKDYKIYLEADRKARNYPKKRIWLGNRKEVPLLKYQILMRKTEYYNNCKTGYINKIILLWLKYKYKKLSIKYGFTIPINTFGPGLCIAHRGTIVINDATKIGKNCRINIDVNIETNMGESGQSPIIGDNCFIGPGAKLFGRISIGNNVAIGANSVVNKSFPDNVTIAGVPAKIVNHKGTANRFSYYVEGDIKNEKK